MKNTLKVIPVEFPETFIKVFPKALLEKWYSNMCQIFSHKNDFLSSQKIYRDKNFNQSNICLQIVVDKWLLWIFIWQVPSLFEMEN